MSISPIILTNSLTLKRVKDIALSPLFHSLILLSASLTCGFYLKGHLESIYYISLMTGLVILSIALIIHKKKKLRYEITLIKNIIGYHLNYYQWWNSITDKIYLGAIPLENWKHHEKLKKLGITHFVSFVEDFEFEGSLFSSPVKYNKGSSNVKFFPTADFGGCSLDIVNQALNWIKVAIAQGGKCYIHCKAGKGRSAIIVACYVYDTLFADNNDPEAALNYLKNKRKINLNSAQKKAFYEYCASKKIPS